MKFKEIRDFILWLRGLDIELVQKNGEFVDLILLKKKFTKYNRDCLKKQKVYKFFKYQKDDCF